MKNLSSWLIVMFMVIFWVFRIIVTLMEQFGKDLAGFGVFNTNYEIILLFMVLICVILIIKRKLIGSLIYLACYGAYFGSYLLNTIITMTETQESIDMIAMQNSMVALIGVILPVFSLFDILIDKNRKKNPKDKKTDWFFKEEKYDRKLDERADKNQYKTL